MSNKNNSRAVGHAYERLIRLELIDLGWDSCMTSRYASRETDDANVDFVNTKPFNIQAKRWSHAPAYQEVLKSMPQDTNYNVVIHKKPNKGEVVVMDKSTFYELIKMLKGNQII
jgi:hypothetical protein